MQMIMNFSRMQRKLIVSFSTIAFNVFTAPFAQCQVIPDQLVGPRAFFFTFCGVVVAGILANAYLVGLVRPNRSRAERQRRWEFVPQDLGGFSWPRLALWSVLSLFMELLMIR